MAGESSRLTGDDGMLLLLQRLVWMRLLNRHPEKPEFSYGAVSPRPPLLQQPGAPLIQTPISAQLASQVTSDIYVCKNPYRQHSLQRK